MVVVGCKGSGSGIEQREDPQQTAGRAALSLIKALFLGKVGYILSQCSDNLVISSIVSVTAVGLYSNYTTLISSVSGFVTTFSSGVTASMGNLIASESKERAYEVYKRIDFINFWMYTFSSICLLCLTEPFIKIWLGEAYVLSKGILVVAVVTFYLKGINSGVDVEKTRQDCIILTAMSR